jgi:hypothetical protein
MQRQDRASAIAVAILEFRRSRGDVLPSALFGEPAWELLLELFVADANGQQLTAREIGIRSSISPVIMSRWLVHLSKAGFIIGDGSGDLDDPLTLSGSALGGIEQLMKRAHSLQAALTASNG